MSKEREFAEQLIDFIKGSPSRYHVAKNIGFKLADRGFNKLDLSFEWSLDRGKSYFVSVDDSMVVAFKVGNEAISKAGFKIIASHTDSPEIVIKPNPEILSEGYLKLNCEVYGGPILNTWLDRPLGIAGRVILKSEDIFNPRTVLVDFEKPMVTIPNLAIHMNRKVNEGIKLSPQKDMAPIIRTIKEGFEKKDYILELLAKEIGVEVGDIIDFELNLYEFTRGTVLGIEDEFISVPKLDNLAMVHSSLESIVDSEISDSTIVFVAFDHEEIGSTTKQGAGSPVLQNILERIGLALSEDREEYLRAIDKSFMLSCDMVHGLHPNKLEKQDPTNKPIINQGPAAKNSARRSYTTDGQSFSVYKSICDRVGINLQRFLNHSDERGGSTIGPINSTQLPIRSIDIGNPMLAMHSIREFGGVKDHYNIYKSFCEFYSI